MTEFKFSCPAFQPEQTEKTETFRWRKENIPFSSVVSCSSPQGISFSGLTPGAFRGLRLPGHSAPLMMAQGQTQSLEPAAVFFLFRTPAKSSLQPPGKGRQALEPVSSGGAFCRTGRCIYENRRCLFFHYGINRFSQPCRHSCRSVRDRNLAGIPPGGGFLYL